MKRELSINQNLMYTCIYLLIAFTLTNIIGEVLLIEYGGVAKLIITILLGLTAQLIVVFPISIYLLFVASLPFLLLLNLYNSDLLASRLLALGSFINNVWNHIRTREEILLQHTKGLWLLLVFIICLLTAIAIFKIKRPKLLLPIYLYFIVYYWYIHINIAYQMMGLFLILFIILMSLENYLKRSKSSKSDNIRYSEEIYRLWLRTIFSYSLIIVILASFLPKLSYRVDLYWLENSINQYFPAIAGLRDDFDYSRNGKSTLFSLSETGFQERRSLGGPVKQSDRLVMLVKAPYQLYLRGSIKSLYSRNSWLNDDKSYVTYLKGDELPMEVNRGKEAYIEVTLVNISTNTVFTPYQPLEILLSRGGRLQSNDEYHIIADNAMHKNDKYIVRALMSTEEASDKDHISAYLQYKYLQLPSDLSPKIAALADEITNTITEPYTKAIAIRDYLRSNYEYSIDVPVIPMHKEFVEYFLFEEMQGYCTYFASALAIMLRTQGIPARYVEGYRLPSQRNKDGIYEVKQTNAHAWVEAYLPELGWITLEATPAYNPIITGQEGSARNGEAASDSNEFDELQALMELQRNSISSNTHEVEGVVAPTEAIEVAAGSSKIEVAWKFVKRLLPILLQLMLFAMLPLRCLYMYLLIRNHKRKVLRSETRETIITLYNNILELLVHLEYPIITGETPYEFDARIKQYIYDNHQDFSCITHTLMLAMYSQVEMHEEDKARFLCYLDFIEKKVKFYLGFWRYYYLKFIKGSLYTVIK